MDRAYVETILGRTVPQNFVDWLASVGQTKCLVKWALEDMFWDWLGQKM